MDHYREYGEGSIPLDPQGKDATDEEHQQRNKKAIDLAVTHWPQHDLTNEMDQNYYYCYYLLILLCVLNLFILLLQTFNCELSENLTGHEKNEN